MTDFAATPQPRRAYDHRLREQVLRSGTRALTRHLAIPRSTVSTWRRRGLRPVTTIEPIDQDRQQLLDLVAKLNRRARILAAVVRVLLALLRASGFTLAGDRLPEGAAKAGILLAISSATPVLPLAKILRILHLEPGRYRAWNSRASTLACGLDDRSSCPRTSPSQLTPTEVADIKDMALAPDKRHMSLRTLALHAQRIGKVFASASTWAKLVRERGWRRPRQRIHPPKPTVGVRASQPNEIWHVDTTVINLLDGTKAYLQAVIDNFSRKILAWTVSAQQSTGRASRSEPGDDLRPVHRSASQPSRITNSSMISALTLLRTLFYGRSAHTARMSTWRGTGLAIPAAQNVVQEHRDHED